LFFTLVGALQVLLAARVFFRMLRTAGGQRVETCDQPSSERISVILPVLNEASRIADCLEGLITQPREIAEILVVDGGSTDRTRAIVEDYRSRDARVQWLDASPVDPNWTGKSWGLNFGLARSSPSSQWILCVDADVRVSAQLARSLLAHTACAEAAAFSIATRQHLSGALDAFIHPAFLTTLVYRFGQPGTASENRHHVHANGQCFFGRRDILIATEAFAAAKTSLCEDITIVRRLAECGESAGFYETAGLADVWMYGDWRETWANWPRSLPMRDQYFGATEAIGLLEVLWVQGAPLPMVVLCWGLRAPVWLFMINAGLLTARLGVLAGTARAYPDRPWTYWLSPFCDFPAALRLLRTALSRKQSWRGRSYVRRSAGRFIPMDSL
jgi:dolichol-phosphate mannosyltransferase